MTAAILLLGHGVLGVLSLLTLFLKPPWRERALVGICVIGAGLGAALVVLNGSADEWRTAELGGVCVLAGASIAAAWMATAVVGARSGSALSCGLIGIASSALALSVTNEWSVPLLLFWLCSSLAVAALAARARTGIWVWAVLFFSDVLFVGALVGNWTEERSWLVPSELDGWPFYVLLAAVALRVGVIPASGTWSLSGTAAPAIPLLVGGGFSLLPIALGEAAPWLGVVLFVASLSVAATVLLARRPSGGIAAASAPAIAVMLGLAVIAPAGVIAAGLAAIVAAGTAAVWLAVGREEAADRVIALTAIPPTVAYLAAITGVVAAVGRTVSAEEVVDKVPWTLALVLGPLALTANVAVAVRIATALPRVPGWFARARSFEGGAMAVLVSRILLVFAVAAVVMPGEWLAIQSPFAVWDERRAILIGAALVLGAGVAWLAARGAVPVVEREPVPERTEYPLTPWLARPPRGSLAIRLLTGAALLLAVGSIAAVGWFTFEGLRLGFL